MARNRRWAHAARTDEVREEVFRILRANLEVAMLDLELNSVLITSPQPEAGKSTVCVFLADALAGAGRRVVLVDLDLRRPNAHTRVHAHNEFGVSDVLLEREPLKACLQFVETTSPLDHGPNGFFFLAAGSPVNNPTELLGTSRTARLLAGLAQQADVLLIDAPPVLPVADTLQIARLVGGVVVVAEARETTYPELERTVGLLTRNQARILGVVLNKSRANDPVVPIGYGYRQEDGERGPQAAVPRLVPDRD